MRKLTGHKVNPVNDTLEILVTDEPGAGGANHAYQITNKVGVGLRESLKQVQCDIEFQNGPISEKGVNGITQEVLLEIVADRLRGFQAGPYACRENALALTHVENAQLWLHKRTLDRMARSIEGTSTI